MAPDGDLYRNAHVGTAVTNDGSHQDSAPARESQPFTYQVCERGTRVCSNQAKVEF